jgi:hypothetical protein
MGVIIAAYAFLCRWETLIGTLVVGACMSNWTDSIVGDRMAVDREFNDRVRASEFTNQEWGLIMTAVEFEIEDADDPERARIVADTESLPQVIPELEKVGGQAGPGGRPAPAEDGNEDDGLFGTIRGALGLGGGSDDADRLDAAERLVDEYAAALQDHLESNGKWESVRRDYPD